jgi:hypothetical protein
MNDLNGIVTAAASRTGSINQGFSLRPSPKIAHRNNRDVSTIRNMLAAVAAIALCANLSGCGSAQSAQSSPVPEASSPDPASPAATPACTVQTGVFPLSSTGFAENMVATAQYKFFPCAKYALIFLPAIAGASNATTFTAYPLPEFLIPATIPTQEAAVHGYDDGVEQALMSVEIFAGSNVITYLRNGQDAGWTATGNKGVGLQVITVFLD